MEHILQHNIVMIKYMESTNLANTRNDDFISIF